MAAIAETKTTLLDNKWLMLQIVYQAVATNDTDDTYKYYLGLAETS